MKFSGSERAYAKINLHLEILNKRNDGYHDILSLMSNIDLYDEIEIEGEILSSNNQSEITIKTLKSDYSQVIDEIKVEDNLITKAILIYLEKVNKKGNFTVSVKKNIPSGAGLGGGSSDAAAVLRFLNKNLPLLDEDEMIDICSKIGADVAFCYIGGLAICEGIGEKIQKIERKIDAWIVLVNDGTHVETGSAYKSLEVGINSEKNQKVVDEKKEGIINGLNETVVSEFSHYFVNDFEKTVFRDFLNLGLLKTKLISIGADFSLMSGSGSTVYGLFANEEDARGAFVQLEKSFDNVKLTKFV